EPAERVGWARRHERRQDGAFCCSRFAYRFGWIPGRVLALGRDAGAAVRGVQVFAADAHWVRDDLARLAVFRFDEIKQTHLRNIQYQAATRRLRQYVLGRQNDIGTLARQPWVDVGVGADDFVVTEIVLVGDVEQRIRFFGDDEADFADDVLTFRR